MMNLKPYEWLKQPGRLTAALGRDMTKTYSADWSPGPSLMKLAFDDAFGRGDFAVRDLMVDYLTINEARAKLPWGAQVPMPEEFKFCFGDKDDLFGGYDHNHVPTQTIADIFEICDAAGEHVLAARAVKLIQKLAVDYATQPSSYLTNAWPSKYLGKTGRCRIASMIFTLLHAVKRVTRSMWWGLDPFTTWTHLAEIVNMHLKFFEIAFPVDEAFPGQHLNVPYLSLFQLGMLHSACARWFMDPEVPLEMKMRFRKIADTCELWIKRGLIRDAQGKIVDCWYDVDVNNPEHTANAIGARSGMNEALNLAGINSEINAWLRKVKAKVDPLAILMKFGVDGP